MNKIKLIFNLFFKSNTEVKIKTYNDLYRSNSFSKIRKIRTEFGKIRFHEIKYDNNFDLELITRQYYMCLFGGLNLEAQILLALGKKRPIRFYPLLEKHCKVLRDNGIKVSVFWTRITFGITMFSVWFLGVLLFIKGIFIKKGIREEDVNFKPFIYFDGLTKKNLPDFYPDGSSYDVITWMLTTQKPETKQIIHNVPNTENINYNDYKISSVRGPLPIPKNHIRHLISSSKLIISSLISLLKGEWWKALLLNESLKARKFDFVEKSQVAQKYLFYDSESIYRPMWTYKAEKLGAQIILYAYSTNDRVMPAEGPEENSDLIGLMNWQEYWVWDKQQSNLLKTNIARSIKTKIVGPINFSSRSIPIKHSPNLRVAIFDSPPFKVGAYFGFSTSQGLGLNEAQVHINFIRDIIDVFRSKNKTDFFFKTKRNIDSRYEVKTYLETLNTLNRENNFHILDGDISAAYLIENSDITISYPFTSTAVIAKFKKKVSLFYDPSGKISKFDKASHNVPIISTKNELKKWFLEQLIT